MIPAGILRFQATIKHAPSISTADIGLRKMKNTDYTGSTTFRCDIKSTGSMEVETAKGTASVSNYQITARWNSVSGLLMTDKILWNSKYLNVSGIQNVDNRNEVAIIDCHEVLA